MPEVNIKFEDMPDGNVNMEVKCIPDLDPEGKPSPAQTIAMSALEYIQFINNGGQMPGDGGGCCGPKSEAKKSDIWTP